MNIIRVPVEVGNGSIVMTSIEHNDIEKGTNGEAPPDAQVVVHLDLTGDRVSNAPFPE